MKKAPFRAALAQERSFYLLISLIDIFYIKKSSIIITALVSCRYERWETMLVELENAKVELAEVEETLTQIGDSL